MWEIFAYQNADSLFGIFNAIAAISGANTYLSAIAGVTFCGFVAALLAYAFAPQKLDGWQWLASVVLVYSVLFVPRVQVGIVDKTGGAPVRIVDNVPLGLALKGGLTSSIGNTLTELFETAFQTIPGNGSLPSELTYQKNGLMFGNRLIRDTNTVVFQDPNFRTDLINFIHNCTMYDLIDGTVNPTAFSRAEDVWSLMATSNPARFTTLTRASGTVDTDTCPNAYADLNGRIPAQIGTLQDKLAGRLNPTLPGTTAAAVIATQVQQAYFKNGIASAAATAADIIRQNAVINAINDTSRIIGQKTNDPASMVLAVGRAQAVAQTNAAWINNGKIAEQALPVVRNVVEALAYAMFPIVILLLFLTSGRETIIALKNYLAVLIWIQLWPPLYAILNYMASIYAASELTAAASVGGGLNALSLVTASSIYANAISSEAVVGCLTISIPYIAWAALKRMENLGSTLVSGLSGLQSAITTSTGASAVGNVSVGNVAMDQMQLAPNRSSAFMQSWQSDVTGNTVSSNVLTGRTAASLLRNQGFASRVVSARVSEQDVTEANQQVDAARSEVIATNRERSAVLAETLTKGIAKYRSSGSSDGKSSSSFEETGENLGHLDQITKGISNKTGLSQAQVAQIGFGTVGHIGLNTPLGGGQVQTNAGKQYQSGLSSDQQKVGATMSSKQLAAFKQFGDRVSRDANLVQSFGIDTREVSDLSARLAAVTSRSERAEATLAQRMTFAERLSTARERGETIAIDIAQDPHNVDMFLRYAEQYGGNSAAAFALFDAELARQAMRPNRIFSDGTALPISFEDSRTQYRQNIGDTRLDPDMVGIHRENREQVSSDRVSMQGSVGSITPSDTRLDIQTQGTEIRAETSAARQEFDERAELVKSTNGTLASKKSLLKQSGKQVAEDSSTSGNAAKDVVNKLLKREK